MKYNLQSKFENLIGNRRDSEKKLKVYVQQNRMKNERKKQMKNVKLEPQGRR